VPSFPQDSILTIIALVGTTVVPYNLFLHAALVSEKWNSIEDLPTARRDTVIAIALGGVVSMTIIIAASTIQSNGITNALELAKGLEPLYGDWATYGMGIGLFAAGITSAITAPLAAAYVVKNCFGWQGDLKDIRFRAVWTIILALGVFFLSFDISPIKIIQFAQVANGILLPLIAIFLLWVVNRADVLGKYKNSMMQNVLGILVIATTLVLGARSILKVLSIW